MSFLQLNYKVITLMALFIFIEQSLLAQNNKLQFKEDKTFKIVQFTDMHFVKGGERSPEVLKNIKSVMKEEVPDLVVLTGDIVTSSEEKDVAIASWKMITDLLKKYKTPYAITFGNHDSENVITNDELLEYLSKRPYCLLYDEGGDDVKGVGNFVLPIHSSNGVVEKLLYFLDSGAYSSVKENGVGGYDWIGRSQIKWFAETNQLWLKKNEEVEALFFFHIPLPEYKQAFDDGEYKIGVRMEEECSPEINTGMFAEMVQQGNVLGTFVGHDHNNNYLAQLYNIALCYGYMSGGNCYGDLPLNGARVILLEEEKKGFKTWLRRSDKKKLYEVELPYVEKESNKED
ncbi:MAG: metallophosphoesterase family protein [Bacteroidota bacterium]